MRTEQTKFTDFKIHPAILSALSQMNWEFCTPIQAKTLPLSLKGQDVAGKAQTGTGKTAAFLIAMYQYLLTNPVKPDEKGPWAMILAPTRELAVQIYENALEIGCYTGLNSVAIYGGKDYEAQKGAFIDQQPDIIIGTPGRIIDLYKQKMFHLKHIDCLILDEADRMFDLGFVSDIRFLLKQMTPAKDRLNLIFSATFNLRVQELAYEYLNAPTLVEIESKEVAADKIEQLLYHVANNEKTPLLIGQLQTLKPKKTIVFVNTKHVLDRLMLVLESNGFPCACLSGDLSQDKRERLLKDFQKGNKSILLATDVAARGLHIDGITHVFNYDLPQNPEDYIHRIGRTARAGQSGVAISYGCEDYAYHLPEIEEKLGQKITTEPVLDDMLADVMPVSEEDKAKIESQRSESKPRQQARKRKTRTPYNKKTAPRRRVAKPNQ